MLKCRKRKRKKVSKNFYGLSEDSCFYLRKVFVEKESISCLLFSSLLLRLVWLTKLISLFHIILLKWLVSIGLIFPPKYILTFVNLGMCYLALISLQEKIHETWGASCLQKVLINWIVVLYFTLGMIKLPNEISLLMERKPFYYFFQK